MSDLHQIDKWLFLTPNPPRNLGDVKWLATEDGTAGKGTGRHIACFVWRA